MVLRKLLTTEQRYEFDLNQREARGHFIPDLKVRVFVTLRAPDVITFQYIHILLNFHKEVHYPKPFRMLLFFHFYLSCLHRKHKNKSNKYIKFVDTSLETVQSSRLTLYSCKYSKQVYTQHQLLVLILLKEYISTDYRDFIELIDLMSDIKEKNCLCRNPLN